MRYLFLLVMTLSCWIASDVHARDTSECKVFKDALASNRAVVRSADLACRRENCADACFWMGERSEGLSESEDDERRRVAHRQQAFEKYYTAGCDLGHVPSCEKLGKKPLSDVEIQNAAELEAAEFRETCDAERRYYLHHDCACMEKEYVLERIRQGPTATESSIGLQLAKKCISAEEAKRDIIATCLNAGNAEPYCTCFGETYQSMWEKFGLPGGARNYTAVRSRAMLHCRR